ncbi:MAG TPA: hypothetical protein VFS21_07010 [Roseiflexaceae bacterium]|nr:hypothetical protein [Roseiflexaceae bacterium]
MLRRTTALALAALALLTAVPAYAKPGAPRPDTYTLPGEAIFPEGIASQQGSDVFYVSATSDGTIFRGELDKPAAEVFLPGGQDGRTAAAGLKVDRKGRLFIASGNTGKMFVYDTDTRALLGAFDNDLPTTFVNDVAVARDGTAYFTDSVAPYLYRLSPQPDGSYRYEVWLDFTGTPFVYQPGFNANGIAISQNGRYLVVVQSSTGLLFRIAIATKEVTPIDLGGETLTNGDGVLLQGRSLYVVRNRQELIVKVELSGDLTRGTVVSSTTDPSFGFPTTIARARGRLLVVNSQFDRRGPGLTPDLPFTVSSVPVP